MQLLHRNPRQRIDPPTHAVMTTLVDAIERSPLSYGEIAEAAGVCCKTISNIAAGEVLWPRHKTLDGLCRVLSLRLILVPDSRH